MKQINFEEKYNEYWDQIEAFLSSSKDKENTALISNQTKDISHHYRILCHHLSLSRSRHYSPSLINRLEILVMLYHQELYQRKTHFLKEVVYYFSKGFPKAVRNDSSWFLLSFSLFFGSLLLVYFSVLNNPDIALKIVDGYQLSSIEEMYQPGIDKIGRNRESDTDFQMFGYYVFNNTSIGLRTYASGLVFTIGTFITLLFNGLFIGAIAGHLTYIGYGETFWPFVSGHSALELLAIVISGSAGLKLGYSIISPGRKSRLKSLQDQAARTIYLIYGVIMMFVLAAFVEAYWSSMTNISSSIKYIVGGVMWLALLLYFFYAGRSDEA